MVSDKLFLQSCHISWAQGFSLYTKCDVERGKSVAAVVMNIDDRLSQVTKSTTCPQRLGCNMSYLCFLCLLECFVVSLETCYHFLCTSGRCLYPKWLTFQSRRTILRVALYHRGIRHMVLLVLCCTSTTAHPPWLESTASFMLFTWRALFVPCRVAAIVCRAFQMSYLWSSTAVSILSM